MTFWTVSPTELSDPLARFGGAEIVYGLPSHGSLFGLPTAILSAEIRRALTPWWSRACKNRAELLSRSADLTIDADTSSASIDAIWDFWASRPNNILVPGHDLPMVLEDGAPRYLGQREAAISAWYGEDLNRTTIISLLPN